MSNIKVTAIVPAYNVETYLEKCLTNLVNQTLKDIEIIVIDDGSTDRTNEIMQEFAKKDSRIITITQTNQKQGAARNRALEIAKGEYVSFVDSDDFVREDMFKTLYEKAKCYDSELVLSGVLFVDGNMFSEEGECVCKTYFDKDTQFETKEDLKKLRMGIVGAPVYDTDDSKYGMSIWKNLFKTEVIKKNNITFKSEREMLSEDALFMIDYILCISKATGINEAFYNYCRNEDSISKSYKIDRFEKSLVFVCEVEKRFKKDIKDEEYRIYIDRFWQAMCRVICSQEIMYANENHIRYGELKKRLKKVCTHTMTIKALKSYPVATLPFKHRVFAYCMKYRLYFMLRLLVGLRNK